MRAKKDDDHDYVAAAAGVVGIAGYCAGATSLADIWPSADCS
jgi:hypothetical protein